MTRCAMQITASRLCLALLCLALAPLSQAANSYSQQAFHLPAQAESLLIADLDGDGRQELITVVDDKIRVYLHGPNGFDFDDGFTEISLSAGAAGWDLSSGHSDTGNTNIITLSDGNLVQRWSLENGAFISQNIASNLGGFLNRGLHRLHFSRDINNDGLEDLIIPGAGLLHIYINVGNGDFQAPLAIQSDFRMRTALNINRLNRSTGQSVRIPALELRDVNNDQAADLVSRNDERLDVFLASSTGASYFPSSPTYSVDIAEIEARLGEFDIDNVDFSNLTGILSLTHEEILEDMNGDGVDDLLLREGGKVSLFMGTVTGMNLEQPQQVLRSGGNVLSTFLNDENEDGLKDLWLWRVEPISVGDVFVWLALSGSIAIEAFIYPNEGDRFARRPTRRVNVDLRFPSVIRLASAYESLNSESDSLELSDRPPYTEAAIDDQAAMNDLLVLRGGQVQLFLNSITESRNTEFLGALGYSRERDNYEIDIREIINNVDVQVDPMLTRVANVSADQSIDLSSSVSRGDISAANLNGDGVDDIIVFTEYDGSHIRGLLLISE